MDRSLIGTRAIGALNQQAGTLLNQAVSQGTITHNDLANQLAAGTLGANIANGNLAPARTQADIDSLRAAAASSNANTNQTNALLPGRVQGQNLSNQGLLQDQSERGITFGQNQDVLAGQNAAADAQRIAGDDPNDQLAYLETLNLSPLARAAAQRTLPGAFGGASGQIAGAARSGVGGAPGSFIGGGSGGGSHSPCQYPWGFVFPVESAGGDTGICPTGSCSGRCATDQWEQS